MSGTWQSDHSTPARLGPPVGFWPRFGGFVVDGLLVGLVNSLLELLLHRTGVYISPLISIGYATLLIGGPRGATLGQQLLGLRVVDIATGESIGYGRALGRWAGGIVSAICFLLGYAWMLNDRERQCWHDKLARDVVVSAR